MRTDPFRPIELRLYQSALWLCPPAFRVENADEMLRDFAEARDEARVRGRDLQRLRLLMAIDLVRTLGVQWWRTGLVLIALAALVVPLVAVEALARLITRARFTIPHDADQPELLGLLILTVTSVLVIATTIALTQWASRPVRRRRRVRR